MLSSAPAVELAINARRHGAVAGPCNVWAHLENTDARFAHLLNRPQQLRAPARYLQGELLLTEQSASGQMAELGEMALWVGRGRRR